MNLYVLISSYNEGALLRSCIQSAKATNGKVICYDGPVGGAPVVPPDKNFERVNMTRGQWKDDAAKRTAMLQHVQQIHGMSKGWQEPLWICWLDGDEVLLWGEYLSDWIRRGEAETGAGGVKLRLVELDGSVVHCNGRVIRGDIVKQYLHSIVTVELTNGMIVSLPNEPICAAGGVPHWSDESRKIEVSDLALRRPPVAGEPHFLHRTILRDPSRQAERQSDAESAWYQEHSPV